MALADRLAVRSGQWSTAASPRAGRLLGSPHTLGAVPRITVHEAGIRQFDDAVKRMESLLVELLAAPVAPRAEHGAIPEAAGIYLFSDKKPVYVGQTRNLRARLRNHTAAAATENQASFAFLVGKVDAEAAGIDLKRARKILEADPHFAEHFREAKARVAKMNVRWIELDDPIERTLFEIYAALALDTVAFNSFETH